MWEKTTVDIVFDFIFDYNEKLTTILYWCRFIPTWRHPPVESYNLLSFSNTHYTGVPSP